MATNLLINIGFLIGILLAWQLGAALGVWLLRRLRVTIPSALDHHLVATALGWIIIGLVIYALGLSGLSYRSVILIGTLLLAGLAVIERPWQPLVTALRNAVRSPRSWQTGLLITVVVAFALLTLVGALAPDIEFDSTWYHLPEAQTFLREHTIQVWYPSFFDKSSLAPHLPENLFMWLLAPAPLASTLPQLLQWLSGVFVLLITYRLARRAVREQAAWLAALIVYSTQIVSWLAQTAYVDLIVAYFGLAAGLAIVAWWESPPTAERGNWIGVVGLLIGGLLSSKMHPLAFLPAIILGLILARRPIRTIAATVGLGLLIALPWYLAIWLATGSPFFAIQTQMATGDLGAARDLTSYLFSIHPRTFLATTAHTFQATAPIYLLVVVPLLLWRKLSPYGRGLLAVGLVALWGWSYFPVHEVRYGIQMLPLLAIPIAWLIEQRDRWLRGIVWLTMAVLTVFHLLLLSSTMDDKFAVAVGAKRRAAYLAEHLAGHFWIYYDTTGKIGDLIGEATALYLIHNPAYLNFTGRDAVRWQAAVFPEISTFVELRERWRRDGIRYLVLQTPYQLGQFATPFYPEIPATLPPEEAAKIHDAVTLRYQTTTIQVWEVE